MYSFEYQISPDDVNQFECLFIDYSNPTSRPKAFKVAKDESAEQVLKQMKENI